MSASKPMTVWQAFKREDRWTQFIGVLIAVGGLLNIARIILSALGHGWGSFDINGSVVSIAFAWAWFQWIYWRRRARDAEKPLPPTAVVHDYSTVGAANIARLVDRERRRADLRHAGRQL